MEILIAVFIVLISYLKCVSPIILISVRFGIFGILIDQIVCSILAYIPNSYFSIKLIDYSVMEQLEDLIYTLLLAVTMGIFMYVVGLVLQLEGLTYFLVIGLAGATFYVLTNYLSKISAQMLVLQIVKEQYFKKEYLNKSLNHG